MFRDVLRPRLAPLLAAIGTAALALGALEWVLTPDLFRDDRLGSLLVDRLGDNGYVIHAVVNAEKTAAPSVVFLGGSAARQLIELEGMEARLEAAVGSDLRFLHLSSSDQSFSEDLALLANLDLAPKSLVFVSVSPLRLYFSTETAAIEYRTPKKYLPDETVLRDVLVEHGQSSGTPPRIVRASFLIREFLHLSRLKDHAQRMVAGILAAECSWGCMRNHVASALVMPAYIDGRYHVSIPLPTTPEARRRKLEEARRGLFLAQRKIAESKDYFIDVIGRVVALGKAKGATVVLIDLPNDPWLTDSIPFPWSEYDALLSAVRGTDTPYLDLRRLPNFGDELFVDLIHVSTEGRRRFGPVFVDAVKRYLTKDGSR